MRVWVIRLAVACKFASRTDIYLNDIIILYRGGFRRRSGNWEQAGVCNDALCSLRGGLCAYICVCVEGPVRP